jgi:hypothetical protein
MLLGDDFTMMDAEYYFTQVDNMIEYFNDNVGQDYNIELIYSTPSIYIDYISEEEISWPTRYDDMFPYKDHKNAYWTGFYSSRPQLKSAIRSAS